MFLPPIFIRMFYLCFCANFALLYVAALAVVFTSAGVGDARPTVIGALMGALCAVLIAMGFDQMQRAEGKR